MNIHPKPRARYLQDHWMVFGPRGTGLGATLDVALRHYYGVPA